MTALEILLCPPERQGGYSQTFKNNAAWLGGLDDEDRRGVRALAGSLYDAGSRYRHGTDLYTLNEHGTKTKAGDRHPRQLDVRRVDRLVRRLLLHALGLLKAEETPDGVCAEAQYSRSKGERIRTVLVDFHEGLAIPLLPFEDHPSSS